MQAIIMAGGKGRRLRPYTTILPKPLMPIGDIPILELILRQLKYHGFQKVTLAVGYLSELLRAYFGNGQKWGIEITYSYEDKNLGTIGPLSLINDLQDTFLVMNGDILTNLNYRKLFEFHQQSEQLITIASFIKQIQIDLGVLSTKHDLLTDYTEKPILNYQVSMGIYVMNRQILEFISHNKYLDIPSLMRILLDRKKPPKIFQHKGKWLDIGRKEDYENAINEFDSMINEFLPEGK